MKRCPACRRVYTDETLKFCRDDGATLVVTGAVAAESAESLHLSRTQSAEAEPTRLLGVHATETAPRGAQTSELEAPRLTGAGALRMRARRRRRLWLVFGLLFAAAVAAALGVYFYRHARDSEVAIDSVAVLPFANQNGDPELEYLSDGLTESIINSLTQLPDLRVLARSTVFRYKGKDTDPVAAGRELGARAVLTGRVTQRGDNLLVSAELVDARDNKQVWGGQYSRKVSDLADVQRTLSHEITERLRLTLTDEGRRKLARGTTADPEAFQLYLKGRYFWNKRTPDGVRASLEHFQRAIDEDPTYALAYAGLADAYNVAPSYGLLPPKEAFPRSKEAATRALQLDDSLAEAHAAMGVYLSNFEWRYEEAEAEFRRAVALDPKSSTAHYFYSYALLTPLGRHDEAVAEMRAAQESEPLSLIINTNLGWALIYARRHEEAVAQLRKVLELDVEFAPAYARLAEAYAALGRHEEAVAAGRKGREMREMATGSLLASLGYAYAAAGREREARQTLAEAKALAAKIYVSPVFIAKMHAALGERDQAFEWLRKAHAERDYLLPRLKVEPAFDAYHQDPRFADLARKANLTP